MKNKEELTALKEEIEVLNKKLSELTEEELAQVSGGFVPPFLCTASFKAGQVFSGSDPAVQLNMGVGPEVYDCSGLVT